MRQALLVFGFLFAGSAASADMGADIRIQVESCVYEAPDGDKLRQCLFFPSNRCMEQPGGYSTVGTVLCLQAEQAGWQALLDDFYGQLAGSVAGLDRAEPVPVSRVSALEDAQRAWVAFRDADCNFAHARWADGSISGISAAECHLARTAERSVALLGMLDIEMGSD